MRPSAVEAAESLAPWIAPNAQAMQRGGVEAAVLRALGYRVPPGTPNGVPLLRFVNGDPAIRLVDAVLDPPRPRAGTPFLCDVDDSRGTHPNVLWIPAGASVVQLSVRGFVRDVLDYATGNTLVWF